MSEWGSRQDGIIDGHVHMGNSRQEQAMLAVREAAGIERINLVSIQKPREGSGLPQSLYMKARHPDTFFVFAGLNHAQRLSNGMVKTPTLAEQAGIFARIGCDGIKMLEGKPTSRQEMDVPITDPYFAEYWARVEEMRTPMVWHVNDPEEFWDPATTPGWAKERNWGYGPDDVTKEQLYAEVDEVLAEYPNLNAIFAHFYFLSADLPRAARFLDEHPSVRFDLAPGIEMLYNMSRDPAAGREFFIRYSDRIVFGTDLASGLTPDQARFRAGIVFRWLETEDTFRVPDGADFLLGPPEDGVIRGMALPGDALAKIYRDNFIRAVGPQPKPLDRAAAVEECRRLAAIAEGLSGAPGSATEASRVAEALGE
ncbi:MAG: amidohydrolase family protein [Kiritimatiellae bacterium]|nr:amidohydrolase family protein [Kiritimatiellia bacterium]